MCSQAKKKIVIAAGGTGGHLFPAQALGRSLSTQGSAVAFYGCGLQQNRFFLKEEFDFCEISGATPFKKSSLGRIKSLFSILKGIKESLRLLSENKPDIVVGFGSYHSFPVLAAAIIQRIPIVLFEPNAIAGRVNRLLSAFTQVNALQFLSAKQHMKGNIVEVAVPLWMKNPVPCIVTQKEARRHYGLQEDRPTIVIFGGSQGADKINHTVVEALKDLIAQEKIQVQVIHITGKGKDVSHYQKLYDQMGIGACVKEFEDNMPYAYQAADFAICRSGAATIAELRHFEVPALFIPYPFAVDDHQSKNAQVMVNMTAAISLLEKDLTPARLTESVLQMFSKLEMMKSALKNDKSEKASLTQVVTDLLA